MFAIRFWFSMLYGIYAKDFIINTEECKLPFFEAFSEESNQTYSQLPYLNCSDLSPLTYTTVENNVAYLRIRTENIDQYYLSQDELDCCYSYVTRNGTENEPDVGISVSACWYFNSTVRLHDYIVLVKCYMGADVVYENVHNPIVITESVKDKINKPELEHLTNRPLSVLFIVVDSISRLNVVRTMPKTRTFLLENDFTEFQAYNKIDDNTFPNFNALLTGLNLAQSDNICKPNEVGMLDRCPMIWYDFRKHGYVTAYAEDWADITTYNYLKKGFLNPPTDYYFKPYIEAAESLQIRIENYMPYCAGPETEGERILNLARDFASTFKKYPSFGIFWMNTFSHNYISSPSRMDGKIEQFFRDLKHNGILNESAVIFLSDHGIRFGNIRTTIQGWYEERLPANLISLPPWFRQAYPEKYDNLMENSKKLTSTYDLYMTLREILAMASGKENIAKSKACPTCTSLFSQIPETRSCKQAGIPEIWCTCLGRFERVDTDFDNAEVIGKALEIISKQLPGLNQNSSSSLHLIAITENSTRKNYLLMNLRTDIGSLYQALFRIKNNFLDVVKLLKLMRIY